MGRVSFTPQEKTSLHKYMILFMASGYCENILDIAPMNEHEELKTANTEGANLLDNGSLG
jgi:hypothetical protein